MSNAVEFTGLTTQRERLRSTIDRNIGAVLDHGRFIMGPEVREFEEKLESFCGAKHAIGCANGTDALQIALMATGIGRGDAVLVPSFTYTATAEVILVLGATPVFVEVDGNTFNLSLEALEQAITKARADGLNPRAIMSVDLFGLPADCDAVAAIAEREDMVYISDAAQSFGARLADGRAVGTLAQITTTSFFPAKPLGCFGDGGAVFTDDDELAAAMRSIRVHGQGSAKYETVRVGMNSRLDTIQAAVLNAKIDIFAEEIANRNALADAYEKRLASIVATPKRPEGVVSAWAQYTIRVSQRDAIQAELNARRVPTAVYYPLPMHLQPAYASYGDGAGSMPLSEQLSREVLSLPMNPYWTSEDVEIVCTAIEEAVQAVSVSA